MRLYTKEGWLDIPHIAEICDKNNINFVIIIGKRQVGKTYGVLKYMLDEKKGFIFLRTNKSEYDVIKSGYNSPFDKIDEYKGRIVFKSEGEYSSEIIRLDKVGDEEIKTPVGKFAALTTFGHIRGINGDDYTDVVHDEFIPEEHMLRVKGAGSALLNLHDSVNGNRELEGRPCLRVWLLANSNDLCNSVLEALNLIKVVERMTLRGEEYHMDKKRGFLVLLPDSSVIVSQRAKGGLYKMIGTDNDYARMALGNEFSKNDFSDVRNMPLLEYNPFITVGKITIHMHKWNKSLYITEKVKAQAKHNFTSSESDLRRLNRQFGDLRPCYMSGRAIFQTMQVKSYFTQIIGL